MDSFLKWNYRPLVRNFSEKGVHCRCLPVMLENFQKKFFIEDIRITASVWRGKLNKSLSLRKKCPYSELFWSKCGEMWTGIAPNTDTFHALYRSSYIVLKQIYKGSFSIIYWWSWENTVASHAKKNSSYITFLSVLFDYGLPPSKLSSWSLLIVEVCLSFYLNLKLQKICTLNHLIFLFVSSVLRTFIFYYIQ